MSDENKRLAEVVLLAVFGGAAIGFLAGLAWAPRFCLWWGLC